MNLKRLLLSILLMGATSALFAQNFYENASISGSLKYDGQLYLPDDAMGIPDSTLTKHFGMNAFGELDYTVGNFRAGMRYEMYTPPLNGFDEKSKGYGIPFFYANYANKFFDVTIGDFYEQFGSGLTLRSYQEWNLGYDNAIRGAKVIIMPYKGIRLKALTGYQRWFWNEYVDISKYTDRGLVSGFDGDILFNDVFNWTSETHITLGGSFVTKHEKCTATKYLNDTLYELKMPTDVAAWSGRMNITRGGFGLYGEYAYKINNPSVMNDYSYNPGQALFVTASYSTKGFGVTLAAKRIDNMYFKSTYTTSDNAMDINFIPPLSKQHHYSLPSLYPYASQPNGEMSLKGNVIYTIPKKTKIGGKYGMSIEADFTIIYDTKKIVIDEFHYESPFFQVGDNELFRDFNVIVTKKFSKSWKAIFTYINLYYDKDRVEGHTIGEYGVVNANIGIADVTWKINSDNSLRFEGQALFVGKNDDGIKQDRGDWATLTLEYTLHNQWFLTVLDEWNYGNPEKSQRLHYYYASIGFIKNATRIALSYGRQREGLLCVGGVCRYVPAASGASISISTSF